jgi:hypothetical protein
MTFSFFGIFFYGIPDTSVLNGNASLKFSLKAYLENEHMAARRWLRVLALQSRPDSNQFRKSATTPPVRD